MADVGVRELKQRLSEYLDRAERGELLLVTERGRPKAVLGPLPGRGRVQEGNADVWITPGSGGKLGAIPRWKASRQVSTLAARYGRSMRSTSRPLKRIGGAAVPFCTFDVRQAQAARNLGLTVVGA